MDETHVVTCFLRNRGDVLLLRRSDEVGSYSSQWGGVAGHAEGEPDELAREEIEEETGLLDACRLVRRGDPFEVQDVNLGVRWVVHPHLFDCDDRDAQTDWETTEAEWASPTEILRRETVPDLWRSYERVAPSVESVAGDYEHGSAYLSVRALEVLRDRAGEARNPPASEERRDSLADDWADLASLARDLLAARPSMAALANRVNRAMRAASDDRTPEAVERAAGDGIERALSADDDAAETAADRIADETILTLSRSGTVGDALPAASTVFVSESRPACEGREVAESLAERTSGSDVTLHTDAAVAHVLATRDVGSVVVGADTVLPGGDVVNKTGTRAAALAAQREEVPLLVVTASDKVSADDEPTLEEGDSTAVYDGDADVSALNPTFDVTPADHVSGYVTERGVLDGEEIRKVAEEHRELTAWRDET